MLVYDISVSGCHEFFANGILVHNSTSSTHNRKAAFSVGVKMGKDHAGRFWVLDVKRGQWDSWTREQVIRNTAVSDGKHVIVGVEQEPGSGGKDSALDTVKRLAGWKVIAVPAAGGGGKELRADPFSVQVNAGNVWLPEGLRRGQLWVGWAKDYVDELRHWPFSSYLDQGDASGGSFNLLDKPKIRVGALKKRRREENA